jgi:hypothetical protein
MMTTRTIQPAQSELGFVWSIQTYSSSFIFDPNIHQNIIKSFVFLLMAATL